MYDAEARGSRKLLAIFMSLFLCSGLGAVFVLGQGGTGRETPNVNVNANASKSTSTPKRKRPAKKTSSKNPSTPPSDNRSKQTTDDPKTEDVAATERSYWETIKSSTNSADFKAYLAKYPNGQFAVTAREHLKRLETVSKPLYETDAQGRIILGTAGPRAGSMVKNQLGMELIYIPAGKFLMGSNTGKPDEQPVHEVTFKRGFYMGRHEVTQQHYQQVMGSNPSYNQANNLPVEQVSWDDAQRFISKLNAKADGFVYRLPSEAEWAYASRGGTIDGLIPATSWYSENSKGRVHAVGQKQPNDFGLYDMQGNVWEWCADYYHENYNGAPVDGSPRLTVGKTKHRVKRGGAWNSGTPFLRSSARAKAPATTRDYSIGFRVVAVAANP